MLNSRLFTSVFFAFALLFAQQGGALHALRHAFEEQIQQKNKQSPHSQTCEQCASYAQLGSALNSGFLSFDLQSSLFRSFTQAPLVFFTQHTLPAIARGPPLFQSLN